jgi:enamine deaminase RidA (YjgF/YER057c/UK114 family)
MPISLLNPASLPRPSGFSHGVLADGGRLLFLAGQTGTDVGAAHEVTLGADAAHEVTPGADGAIAASTDLVLQFAAALANLQVVVAAAGGQMTDVVKLTIYVTDKAAYRASLAELGAAYRQVFGRYYPAMTLVEVKSLFDDRAMVEIEGLAVLAGSPP